MTALPALTNFNQEEYDRETDKMFLSLEFAFKYLRV